MQTQFGLFNKTGPAGLDYWPELIDPAHEQALAARIAALDLKPFAFRGYLGKRRTASFGWHYDFAGGGLQPAEPMPDFLLEVREQAARLAGLEPDALQHVLLTEYEPGAGIGWHRDRAVFDQVVGISLLSQCRLRFRRKAGAKWERHALDAEPRSYYLLTGPARFEWEHSIAAVEALRYSITFRSLREATA